MCNKLHEDHVSCPEEGIAWKLFWNTESFIGKDKFSYGKNGFVYWKTQLYNDGDGFCMFETKEEAETALVSFHKWLKEPEDNIKKVLYKEGLGICIEKEFTQEPVRVLIAKKFKIIEEK